MNKLSQAKPFVSAIILVLAGMLSSCSEPNTEQAEPSQPADTELSLVSERLGVSTHSLYRWVNTVKPGNSEEQATELLKAKSEILKLRAQLRRTEDERDILKKAPRYFASQPE